MFKPFKIKHTLKREGATISGRLTDVIWNDNKRADAEHQYEKKGIYICSAAVPSLTNWGLYIQGREEELDNIEINYTYDSVKRAKEVMEIINKATVKTKPIKTKPVKTKPVKGHRKDKLFYMNKAAKLTDLLRHYKKYRKKQFEERAIHKKVIQHYVKEYKETSFDIKKLNHSNESKKVLLEYVSDEITVLKEERNELEYSLINTKQSLTLFRILTTVLTITSGILLYLNF